MHWELHRNSYLLLHQLLNAHYSLAKCWGTTVSWCSRIRAVMLSLAQFALTPTGIKKGNFLTFQPVLDKSAFFELQAF